LGIDASRRTAVYLGGFSPHKNLEALPAAFARIPGSARTGRATGSHRLFVVNRLSERAQHASSCIAVPNRLRRVLDEILPSEYEKVVAAQTATAGFEEPVESPFHGISRAYASEIDRSAMWTASREQPHRGADHDSVPAFGVFGVLDGAE
jgi:hypothetical protein